MKRKAYVLKSVLPQGALFPFDFGSVLGSVTDDGNPVDALILTDGPSFCGYLIESRLISCDRSEQSEDGKPERNDRLIAVAAKSPLMPKFGDAPKYPWAWTRAQHGSLGSCRQNRFRSPLLFCERARTVA